MILCRICCGRRKEDIVDMVGFVLLDPMGSICPLLSLLVTRSLAPTRTVRK